MRGTFRPSGEGVLVRKTANQANSTVVFADVTELAWSVAANGIYVGEMTIFRTAAATTTGLVSTFTGPAAPTAVHFSLHAGPTATTFQTLAANAFGTVLTETGVASTTTPHKTVYSLYLANGANAGTLQLQMRSEVDTSAVTILAGSWGRLTQVG
jgi:hypothetical protein